MQKTGEAYTAARAQLIRKPITRTNSESAVTPAPDYGMLAGMSDAKIKEKTGCTWERWVYALDRKGAADMSHRDIAKIVSEKFKIDGWWAQSVTVGYERIKGLRARGQRRNGSYEMSKSRTFNVPVSRLFDAWADAPTRARWLKGVRVKIRTASRPKSLRLDWPDGGIIAVGFTAKDREKSVVALAHTKLPDRATSDRLRGEWSERLDALAALLTA